MGDKGDTVKSVQEEKSENFQEQFGNISNSTGSVVRPEQETSVVDIGPEVLRQTPTPAGDSTVNRQQPAPTTSGSTTPSFYGAGQDSGKSKTVLAIAIFLFALSLVGLVAYFIGAFRQGRISFKKRPTPTPIVTSKETPVAVVEATTSPTVGWKEVVGKYWQFKVPSEWDYIMCFGETVVIAGPNIEKDTVKECNFGGANNTLYVGRQNGIYQIPVSTTPDKKGVYTTVAQKQNVIVDGKDAVRQQEAVLGSQDEEKYLKVYIQQNGYSDVVSFSNVDAAETFDQILSTFKFIKLLPLTSPSGTPIPSEQENSFSDIME